LGSSNTLKIASGGIIISTSGDFDYATSTGGTVLFNGAGTVSATGTLNFNDVTITSGFVNFGSTGSPTINGTLFLNNIAGGVSNNAPYYANASTLKYGSGSVSPYPRNTEWSDTIGRGYPYDVKVSQNTTLNLGAYVQNVLRKCAGNLTIDAGSTLQMQDGFSNYMSAPLVVASTLNLNGILILSNTGGGDIKVGGDWSDAGTFNANNRAVYFIGSADQTVKKSGGGTETFPYLVIDMPLAGTYVKPNTTAGNLTNITINGTTGSVFQIINNGSLDLKGRTFIIDGQNTSGYTGQIYVTSAASITNSQGISNGKFIIQNIPASNYLSVVNTGMGTLEFDSTVLVELSCGLNCGAGNLTTINGTLQISNGGFVTNNSPRYGSSSLLLYYTGNLSSNPYHRGLEWSDSTGVVGYPNDVQISNSTAVDVGGNGGYVNQPIGLSHDLTIDNLSAINMDATGSNMNLPLKIGNDLYLNGSLSLSNNIKGDLKVAGNWTRSASGNFFPHGRAVYFNGSGSQTITASSGSETFDYLIIDNSGQGVSLASTDANVNNVLTLTDGTFFTSTNKLNILSTSTSAITGYQTDPSLGSYLGSSYVNGNLKRNIISGGTTGTYDFRWVLQLIMNWPRLTQIV
jgi:hypothetical protein